ncbi:MAG TPA: hypothetical protein DDW16_04875 [Clostridiales bacterium]|nr:hypothetical protein [Clostridiales bacterium]
MKVKNDFAPQFNNKKNYNPNSFAKKDAGIVFIVFIFAFYILSFLLSKFIKENIKKETIINHYFFIECILTIISQVFIFLIAFIYSKIRRVSVLNGGGYACKFNLVQMLMAIILAMGIYFVFESVHRQMAEDYQTVFFDGKTSYVPDTENLSLSEKASFLIDIFVLSTVLPAICEEALMRSIIFRSLENYSKVFAIICSGIMFAIFHGNVSQILLQMLGGMAIGLALVATKNFMVSCFMHGAYNFFIMVASIVSENLKEESYNAYLFYRSTAVLFGICFIIIGLTYFVKLMVATEKKTVKVNKAISTNEKAVLFDEKDRVVKEIYAYKTGEIKQYLNDGALFLYGKKFISANKDKNKIFPVIMLAISIIIGIAFIFI